MTTSIAPSLSLTDFPRLRPFTSPSLRQGLDVADSHFEVEFTRLYNERFPTLFRYLDRTLGDGQLASDVAQEAFVRLFDRGSLPDEPAAWLITVANNLVRDHFRRGARHRRLLASWGSDAPRPAAAPDPATSLDHDERQGQVRSALERLAPREREVLIMRHAGYSYREIAAALNLTVTNVSTILLRAGASFRKVYEELHGVPD